MTDIIIENNLNIEVYEYLLDKYPVNPLDNEVKTISISPTDDYDCGTITTDSDETNIDKTDKAGKSFLQYISPEDFLQSKNTRTCDPITGKLLVTKAKNSIKDMPTVLKKSDHKQLGFNLLGLDFIDVSFFIKKFGAKREEYITKDELTELYTMDMIYDESIINSLLLNIKAFSATKWKDTTLPAHYIDDYNNFSLIQKIKKSSDEKFIVFGDFHGGFSTLVRHLFRFRKLKIIDENCKVLPGYNLVFLGDLVDRGRYGYETTIFILLLQLINHDRVFINRGNHEEIEINSAPQNSPLSHEMYQKFGNYNTYNLLNDIFELLPSAIVIEKPRIKHTDESKFIYLAHGGYPVTQLEFGKFNLHPKLYDLASVVNNIIIPNNEINIIRTLPDGNQININSIRWSDFVIKDITKISDLRGFDIGKDIIDEAKSKNIILTIRGHEDQCFSTKFIGNDVVTGVCHKYTDINIFNPNNFKYSKKYNMIKKPKINCWNYSHLIKLDISDPSKVKFNINGITLDRYIPVMTISNNTDIGRDLSKDSYIILNFNKSIKNNCFVEGSLEERKYLTDKLYKFKILPLTDEIESKKIVDKEKRSLLFEYLDKYYKIRNNLDDIELTGLTLSEIKEDLKSLYDTIISSYDNKSHSTEWILKKIDEYNKIQILRNKLYDKKTNLLSLKKLSIEGGYYNKYLKYRTKYLKLKNNL